MKSGIKTEWMDTSVNPGVDFFGYANGNYVKTTKLPAGYPRWGVMAEIAELNLNQMNTIIQEAAAALGDPKASHETRMIGKFYNSGMNEEQSERDGLKPLAPFFALIDQARTRRSLAHAVAQLHLNGIGPFFGFGAMVSFDNASQNIAIAGEAGGGLPEREYYLKTDAASVALRQKYLEHVERMFLLLGDKPQVAKKNAAVVLSIETKLAQVTMVKEDRRKPEKVKHPFTLSQFKALFSGFDLVTYFNELKAPVFDSLNVTNPDYFKALSALIASTPLAELRTLMRWELVNGTAGYLPRAFGDESFAFYGKELSGLSEQRPRWKRVIGTVNGALGEPVGKVYVARHFPAQAKTRMLEMIENAKIVLAQALEKASWLDDATRPKLLEKLGKITWKIGYPDKWRDYSALTIREDSFVLNVLATSAFGVRTNLNKIGTEVDKTEWHMSPQTVNAYANPPGLEIVFPAGILQAPIFDLEQDDAANYGRILAIILHEFWHHWDDAGSMYGSDGSVGRQWSPQVVDAYTALVDKLRHQFSGYSVGPNHVHLDGNDVCGEAAADLNGVTLAYRAFQLALDKKGRSTDEHGFSDNQRFFIAFGQVWATVITDAAAEQQAKQDPHPPAQFRVNGTLGNLEIFAQAFGLPDNAPIMLPVGERAHFV